MVIIPAIDILKGKCVRLYQGDYSKETVYSNDPVEVAEKWETEGAEIIHLVDLDGAKIGNPANLDIIRKICTNIDIPCEFGGGIRNIEDADAVINTGVTRIILGTAAVENKTLVSDLLKKYNSEKIIIGIDAKDGFVAVKGWLEKSKIKAVELAEYFALKGITRFIYTDISRDGALTGPNYDSIKQFCKAVPECSIIASGGVGSKQHIKELLYLKKGCSNLEGIIIGKALYNKNVSLDSLSKIL
ncbi:MAG: 1-(5-phosphoribosyl)-5-[(5-phosphoribosylamino)methylideneamino]imidazole-4-carboxamide isomerase [Victivallales bacterium]|nr:1-(5-phosphoribosyl)-5-[(5-phosphoribosylamino)methylideneamino]imidazole-4-carboxamide isomerase [Victivallales bacterium]MCF7889473.1 1-(5-phosphoribosyl)-5-[(5-phosphoribosylamino)methylideneamino]imidazole-4-carboxamide isomerase [Victivallales bacterium]